MLEVGHDRAQGRWAAGARQYNRQAGLPRLEEGPSNLRQDAMIRCQQRAVDIDGEHANSPDPGQLGIVQSSDLLHRRGDLMRQLTPVSRG